MTLPQTRFDFLADVPAESSASETIGVVRAVPEPDSARVEDSR